MIVNSERAYGKIKNVQDLKVLQKQADEFKVKAVGITENGSVYTYDSISDIAIPITGSEAQEILDLSNSEFEQFTNKRGDVEFTSKLLQNEEDPTVVEAVEEVTEGDLGEVMTTETQEHQEETATFQEEVVEEVADARSVEEPEVKQEEQVIVLTCPECEDCSVHKDKIFLAKALITEKIDEIDEYKKYLQRLLEILE
jgi:hypothetical protein